MEFNNKDIRKNIECYVGFLDALKDGTNSAREYLNILMDSNVISKDGWGIATRNCHNEQDMRDIALQFLVGDIIYASGIKTWKDEEDIIPETTIVFPIEEKEI
jgi:hypothetical protein